MPHSSNPFKLWAAYNEAAIMAASTFTASATTIANRLFMLGTAGVMTDPKAARREASQMVSEKMNATVESAVAATKAMMSVGATKNQHDFAMATVKVGMAALKPYKKRATRNAERLSSRAWR